MKTIIKGEMKMITKGVMNTIIKGEMKMKTKGVMKMITKGEIASVIGTDYLSGYLSYTTSSNWI
jgi:molybdopterin-binding protein